MFVDGADAIEVRRILRICIGLRIDVLDADFVIRKIFILLEQIIHAADVQLKLTGCVIRITGCVVANHHFGIELSEDRFRPIGKCENLVFSEIRAAITSGGQRDEPIGEDSND